jgi:16S rRNA processing protein RimM
MYLIGYITTTHGIKGELKIKNLSDYDRFHVDTQVIINQKKYDIERIKHQHDRLIVKFKQIHTMNEALELKDQEVYIEDKVQDDFGIHYSDILGKDVYDINGKFIGFVKYLREVPQGHLIEIDMNGKLKLIPFVDAFIKEVLHDRIVIEVIEGLL